MKTIARVSMCLALSGGTLVGHALWLQSAAAQAFPVKPLRVIVPTSAGALNDLFTRTMSQKVAEAIGQQVLVDNRPGISSIIGMSACAKSPPDGYTVCITTPEALVLNPHLFTKLPYDPEGDFAPVTQLANTIGIIFANAEAPGRSFPEMIAYAKANPGKLNYATWGAGSVPAVFLQWINRQNGVDITAVPYKGAAPSLPAVLAGDVHMTYLAVGPVMPHFRSGKLKPLAVTGSKRSSFVPDVPSLAEYNSDPGLPTWFAMFAPGKTPRPLVQRVSAEYVKALNTPQLQEFMFKQTLEVVASTPEQFAEVLKIQKANAARIFKTLGIRPTDAPN